MKKNRELPTFTVLNPEFHATEHVTMDVHDIQEDGEESPIQDENYQG